MNIIFDVDGTLFDTVPIMFKAINASLKDLGYSQLKFKQFIRAFNPKNWDATFQGYGIHKQEDRTTFLEYYLRNRQQQSLGKPLIFSETMRILTEQKHRLFIITTGRKSEIKPLLDQIPHFEKQFLEIYYERSEKVHTIKEIVDKYPSDISYYIGDSIYDAYDTINARGHGVNIRFVGLTYTKNKIKNMRNYHQRFLNLREKMITVVQPEYGDVFINDVNDILSVIENGR